jgi:uncharacterized protein YehS (DUF1456 family)
MLSLDISKSIRYLLEVCNTQKTKRMEIDGKMLLFITNFTKETWLREEENFYLPGFKVLRRDGPE